MDSLDLLEQMTIDETKKLPGHLQDFFAQQCRAKYELLDHTCFLQMNKLIQNPDEIAIKRLQNAFPGLEKNAANAINAIYTSVLFSVSIHLVKSEMLHAGLSPEINETFLYLADLCKQRYELSIQQ